MLDIKYRFTCGDSDLSKIIKKCQNIMTRIVIPWNCSSMKFRCFYIFLGFSQYKKCRDKGSLVPLILVTWLRNELLHFWSFTEFNVMSAERPDLSRKCQISGKSLVSQSLVTWLRNYKFFYFRSFTQVVVLQEKRPELSKKWWISGDLFFRQ